MANSIFQSILHQMQDNINRVIGVTNENGVVLSCNDLAKIGEQRDCVTIERANKVDMFANNGYSYHLFSSNKHNDHAVFVEGIDGEAERIATILAITFQNIKQSQDDKSDKSNFVKNIVLDNILPGDLYGKARELNFASDVCRVVLLIRVVSGTEISACDIVSELFPDKQKDFIFHITETDTVLVKEVKKGISSKDIENLATSIIDTLNSEHYIKTNIGIGSSVIGIKDLATSFKEAQIALEVGKVFDTERNIISYSDLGIARLIYQLPTTLCEMFLNEVFKQESVEKLDAETLFTIQRFFENNLNVSETSRGLFVHRNTLVYRLEKIKKLTGLDLREFDDAIIFKVALMVKKYLSTNPAKY